MMPDPMALEFQGEAYTYPADITVDIDGEKFRRAVKIVRALTNTQFDQIMGPVDKWPAPAPYINGDPDPQQSNQ